MVGYSGVESHKVMHKLGQTLTGSVHMLHFLCAMCVFEGFLCNTEGGAKTWNPCQG